MVETFADKIFSCLADDSSILVIARSEQSLAEEIFEQVKIGRSVCYLKFR